MLDKYDIRQMKDMAKKVDNGEASEKEFLEMLRENAGDILDMAEKSLDLEFENERLKIKLDIKTRGMRP